MPGKAIERRFCEVILTIQIRVLFGEIMSWLLAKTDWLGSNVEAVYKDAVVQLVHAPSCSSTKNACLAEVTGPKPESEK